jgi:hypothetical protein
VSGGSATLTLSPALVLKPPLTKNCFACEDERAYVLIKDRRGCAFVPIDDSHCEQPILLETFTLLNGNVYQLYRSLYSRSKALYTIDTNTPVEIYYLCENGKRIGHLQRNKSGLELLKGVSPKCRLIMNIKGTYDYDRLVEVICSMFGIFTDERKSDNSAVCNFVING